MDNSYPPQGNTSTAQMGNAPLVSVSATGTISPNTIEEDTGTITRTIPLAGLWSGQRIQCINIGTGVISLTCAQQIYSSNGIIAANTPFTLPSQGEWIVLQSDGVNIIQVS
jgi:hypothetical protein